jgi:hypothetical protein
MSPASGFFARLRPSLWAGQAGPKTPRDSVDALDCNGSCNSPCELSLSLVSVWAGLGAVQSGRQMQRTAWTSRTGRVGRESAVGKFRGICRWVLPVV